MRRVLLGETSLLLPVNTKERKRVNGKLVTIRINPEIHEKAKEMGLNISKTCENALKNATSRLTSEVQQAESLAAIPSYGPVEPGARVRIPAPALNVN
jgi:post-segregation antitoxin (ccd killing protein)